MQPLPHPAAPLAPLLEVHESAPEVSILLQPATPVVHDSPNRSPRRVLTYPEGGHSSPELQVKAYKRIVIFCDGTWQDGISVQRSRYTNVLRLARTVNYEDDRFRPAIPQIVFYQSGVGTEKNLYSRYVEGGTLADKVEEAYAFIAHNYSPGDEIFLFGFSRGAYTARMISMFIGEIGILDRKDMNNFGKIFVNFQKLGDGKSGEKELAEQFLEPWRSARSKGKRRADVDGDRFTVKCVGVWDTVGALGLPQEFLTLSTRTIKLFGFHDRLIGEHVEHAFQALALNEMRADFICNKFEQSEAGLKKGQKVKQCWFAGCHTDIGGGYKSHDLADISLVWMAGQIESLLSLDIDFLKSCSEPVAPWGKQQPHDSSTGIFRFANKIERPLPACANDLVTHETIHPSVLEQDTISQEISELIEKNPGLMHELTSLEQQFKQSWPYDPTSRQAKKYAAKAGLSLVAEPVVDAAKGTDGAAPTDAAHKETVRNDSSSTSSPTEPRPKSFMAGLRTLVRSVSGRNRRPPAARRTSAHERRKSEGSLTMISTDLTSMKRATTAVVLNSPIETSPLSSRFKRHRSD
ncbi:hypothetical protein D9619_003570 [Psilocybe cf. subviscida]|uniref:T6SS Phospholipase effector Tle1-like catalytic domain-containing protein n=1 Tax=Psilocybe cf. subviscida TaxID=2480587 RepID=A0A8H5ETR1_9AGAR|nr:hypothetical protein D9619_003570 [Psilocybe cf. subviscida]